MRSIHPYDPYIPENATKLIVGTMPPYRFCVPHNDLEKLYDNDVNFYYGSRDNCFWKLISEAIGSPEPVCENSEAAIQQRKDLLERLNVGVTDIVQYCIHENQKSDDESLKDIMSKPLDDLLLKYPNIDTLLYTSKKVGSLVYNHILKKHKTYHKSSNKESWEYYFYINENKYDVVYLYSPSRMALKGLGKGGFEKRSAQYKEVFGKNFLM